MLEPSAQITDVLSTVNTRLATGPGLQALRQRAAEFPDPLTASLTGIALDPAARDIAEQLLDRTWSDEQRRQEILGFSPTDREVIIGSGIHAAVYAAVRVLRGHPRPLVLERADRAGGTFAMTARPTFRLNSRNRPGGAGLAGDQGANLNYLPGAPIQAANVSMAEYQTNVDLALVIRLTLAQCADVVTGTEVRAVSSAASGVEIEFTNRNPLFAGRILDARGLGDPAGQDLADGTTILTFAQFMQRMAGTWPLRGVHRAAVVGGGDAGKCAVESMLGIAPQPPMAAAALDHVERIDWYADNLPTTCTAWPDRVRGRYQAIGRSLRPDRFGAQRLYVLQRRARPIPLPGAALIDGRSYDLVVLCTGYRETPIEGLRAGYFERYDTGELDGGDGVTIATKHELLPAFRIGPHAGLPFTDRERSDGVADISDNAASIFRTASNTATLAAVLGKPGNA
ncbi:hypothetical protein [Dactylosporangium sp. NPDC051541]|uniref:hypothetical protein n=1 Tax=Dactylosporangium sp. NPDC051541 TaxID=3363977 RepID=UPI0037AE4A57